jgi:hypothetical protein
MMALAARTLSSRSTTIDQPDASKSLARQAATRCLAPAWRTLVLIAVALVATPTQATTIFFDDFEDDTINGNPAIGAGNIGGFWGNEVSPGVTVFANPNSTGNASGTVLRLHHRGQMNGNFVDGINFNDATLSMDFYLEGGLADQKVTLKALRADNTSAFGLHLKMSGEVGGGVFSTTHYGSGIWQNATWGFTYTGGDNWDVDLTFTNLDTGATTATETQTMALGAALNTELFTAVGARGQGPSPFGGYVDNIEVMAAGATIPEPNTALLLGFGLVGLGVKRRTQRVVS